MASGIWGRMNHVKHQSSDETLATVRLFIILCYVLLNARNKNNKQDGWAIHAHYKKKYACKCNARSNDKISRWTKKPRKKAQKKKGCVPLARLRFSRSLSLSFSFAFFHISFFRFTTPFQSSYAKQKNGIGKKGTYGLCGDQFRLAKRKVDRSIICRDTVEGNTGDDRVLALGLVVRVLNQCVVVLAHHRRLARHQSFLVWFGLHKLNGTKKNAWILSGCWFQWSQECQNSNLIWYDSDEDTYSSGLKELTGSRNSVFWQGITIWKPLNQKKGRFNLPRMDGG